MRVSKRREAAAPPFDARAVDPEDAEDAGDAEDAEDAGDAGRDAPGPRTDVRIEEDAPYYVRNFLSLIRCVHERYADLLSTDEKALIGQLQVLDPNARRLFVRLICRKGPVFRCDRLDYPEIDVPGAIDSLAREKLLERRPELAFGELLELLTADELRGMLADLGASRMGRKAELIERLEDYALDVDLDAYVDWCAPSRREEMDLFRMLFFGNAEQSLTDFVLEELGIVRHERYSIDAAQRLFDDRESVEELARLYALDEESKDYIESGDVEALGELRDRLWDHHEHPELERKRSRILNRIGAYFERQKASDDAMTAYARSGLPPARERHARILVKLDDAPAALEMCQEILRNPHDEFEERFALEFGARIRGEKRQRPGTVPSRTLWLASVPVWPVEQIAAWQLENEGWCAHYVENHLLRALFGLAFWDVIFHPLKGVFHHPYQHGPADLFRTEFREARASLIETRLDEIATGEIEPILDTYDEKQGLANALVNWRHLDRDLVSRAIECIPGHHLAAIFDRLSRDLARYRSGFPDLLLLDPVGSRYKLVEVKGVGDRLQVHQRRWIDHFLKHHIPVEIVRVVWS
jgi:hypothetical protein